MSILKLEREIIGEVQKDFTISRRRVKKYAPQESKGDKIIIIPFSRMIVINPGTPYEQARKFGSMPRLEKKLNEYRELSMAGLIV